MDVLRSISRAMTNSYFSSSSVVTSSAIFVSLRGGSFIVNFVSERSSLYVDDRVDAPRGNVISPALGLPKTYPKHLTSGY